MNFKKKNDFQYSNSNSEKHISSALYQNEKNYFLERKNKIHVRRRY